MKYLLLIFLISLAFIFGFGFQTKGNIDLGQKYRELQDSCSRVGGENANLKVQRDAAEAKQSQAQSDLAASQKKQAELANSLVSCQAEKEKSNFEKVELLKKMDRLNLDITAISNRLDAALESNTLMKSEVESARAERNELHKQRDQAIHDLAIYRQAYEITGQRVTALIGENQALGEQIKNLEEQLKTPALIRLIKAALGGQDALSFPLYFASGLVFAGVASSAGLIYFIRKSGSAKKITSRTNADTRRVYPW